MRCQGNEMEMTLIALAQCRVCGAIVNRSHVTRVDASDTRRTQVRVVCPGCQATGGLIFKPVQWREIQVEFDQKQRVDGRQVAAFRKILDEQVVGIKDIFEWGSH